MRGVLLLMLALAAGCSGLKTYPSGAGGNLAVRAQMDGDVRAALHLHRVDAQCRTEYLGTVKLDRPSLSLALPAGQATWLVVAFDTSSLFAGSRGTSAGMLLTPRAASRYGLAVRYHDSIYDLALSEDGRALPRRDLSACRTGG